MLEFTISALLSGLLRPVVGFAIGKFGVKKIVLYGISVIGVAFLALGSMQQLWHYYAVMVFAASGTVSISLFPSQFRL